MSFLKEITSLGRLRWLQLSVLALLLLFVGVVAFHLKFCVLDVDIWWHLKVGDWIIQHASFPHTGILSRSAADRAWIAYSWGFEVLLSRFYAWFGLLGVGIYGVLLTLMVAFSVYWMVRRLSGNFWLSCWLAVLCCYGFLFQMMPRPVFFSAALFCFVLTLLLEAQASGHIQSLYWLPLLFLFWANLHIQFVYGLGVVGLFLGTNAIQRLGVRFRFQPPWLAESSLSLMHVAAIFDLCLVATLIGPYSYHLYGVVLKYTHSHFIYSMITELQPLSFRAFENYVQLLMAGAAFYAVGRQKKLDLFKLGLLVLTSVVAFRTMRDAWFLCIASAACIADRRAGEAERETTESVPQLAGVFAAVTLGLLLLARGADFNTRGLDSTISDSFPVNAVNYVRQNPAPGPLYNTFDWGGFLTWYMPDYPVVIDGRTDLYGDDMDKLLFKTQNGDPEYRDNVYLNESGLVLLRRRDGLVPTLELDGRFRKIYEDKIATVFVRQ